MSLKHAILGFLNYAPRSGYDLKAAFDLSVQHFWPADQSQIYRTLGAMEEKGWVEVEVVRQEDRPDRKVYSITSTGRDELRHWLSSPLQPSKTRNAALIQIFFAAQLDDEAIIELLELQAEGLRRVLEYYEDMGDLFEPYREVVNSPRDEFFWNLTVEDGYVITECQLKWLESVIARIKEGKLSPRKAGLKGANEA